MSQSFLDGRVTLHAGDCRTVLAGLPDASIDSVVTDPPYALVSIGKRFGAEGAAPAQVGATGAYARASAGFMGKQWDTGETAFAVEFWAQVLRVLKPGGHVIAFGGTRSYHRLACAIEDAGFEIRDQLGWCYGSGFPKSHDVAKGIAKRRVEDIEPVRAICRFIRAGMDARALKSRDLTQHFGGCNARLIDHWAARDTDSQPSLPTYDQWTTLKLILGLGDEFDREFARLNERKGERGQNWTGAAIVGEVASTPAGFGDERFNGDKTIRDIVDPLAVDWQGWGTALKPAWEPIALARKPMAGTVAANVLAHGTGALNIGGCRVEATDNTTKATRGAGDRDRSQYRTGTSGKPIPTDLGRWPANIVHDGSDEVVDAFPTQASGSRSAGVRTGMGFNGADGDGGPAIVGSAGSASRFFYSAKADADDRIGSKHPTVKPVDLMQWLCRLVTPPGGVVLDPFAGTGTTGEAAWREGLSAVLIEREAEYQADIARRMTLCLAGPDERQRESIKAKLAGKAADHGPLFGAVA
jgi:site-specific DNA-methyltransferase (adenine-specific)